MDKFVNGLKMKSKNYRFEWVVAHPGKIFAYRLI